MSRGVGSQPGNMPGTDSGWKRLADGLAITPHALGLLQGHQGAQEPLLGLH